MLDIVHVIVGHWHANIAQFIDHFFGGVLPTVLKSLVHTIEHFSEILLGLLAIDLRKLLHL